MAWEKTKAFGDREARLTFSRHGRLHRHFDRGIYPTETLRISGKHLRVVLEKRAQESSLTKSNTGASSHGRNAHIRR